MNQRTLPALAAILIVMSGLIGCAGSRPKAMTEVPGAPSDIAAEPPAVTTEPSAAAPPTPAAAQPAATEPAASQDPAPLTEEEQMLLEDNTDWALQPDEEIYTVADPLEKYNRGVFYLNDKLLQGKARAAEAEWARFLYNSTIGVLGFGDPASKHAELNPAEEDMGQTLAGYGLGDGFYLVWPLLGPSTLRDTAGMVGDRFLNPVAFVERWQDSLALSGTKEINNLSFRIGDYESLIKAALDPYESFRNAYIQLRQSKIRQ
ncbi:MAG: VacJ family lipoprotein [Desulfatitalea sp.]|nr:VacJ family lipoprotein [Desulfatitalea sp.]